MVTSVPEASLLPPPGRYPCSPRLPSVLAIASLGAQCNRL